MTVGREGKEKAKLAVTRRREEEKGGMEDRDLSKVRPTGSRSGDDDDVG